MISCVFTQHGTWASRVPQTQHSYQNAADMTLNQTENKSNVTNLPRNLGSNRRLTTLQQALQQHPNSYVDHSKFVLEQTHQNLLHNTVNNGSLKGATSARLRSATRVGGTIMIPTELSYLSNAVTVNGVPLRKELSKKTIPAIAEVQNHFPGKKDIPYDRAMELYEELYRNRVSGRPSDTKAMQSLHYNLATTMHQVVNNAQSVGCERPENLSKIQSNEEDRLAKYESAAMELEKQNLAKANKLNELQKSASSTPRSYEAAAKYHLESAAQSYEQLMRRAGYDTAMAKEMLLHNLNANQASGGITPPAKLRYIGNAITVEQQPLIEKIQSKPIFVTNEASQHFPERQTTYGNALNKYEELYRESMERGVTTHNQALAVLHQDLTDTLTKSINENNIVINKRSLEHADFNEQHRIKDFINKQQKIDARRSEINGRITNAEQQYNNNPNSYIAHSSVAVENIHNSLDTALRTSGGNPSYARDMAIGSLHESAQSKMPQPPAGLNYIAQAFSAKNAPIANELSTKYVKIEGEATKHFNGANDVTYTQAMSQYESLYHEKVVSGTKLHDAAIAAVGSALAGTLAFELGRHPLSDIGLSEASLDKARTIEIGRVAQADTQMQRILEQTKVERALAEDRARAEARAELQRKADEDANAKEMDARNRREATNLDAQAKSVSELHANLSGRLSVEGNNPKVVIGMLQNGMENASMNGAPGLDPAQYKYISEAVTVGGRSLKEHLTSNGASSLPASVSQHFNGATHANYKQLLDKYEELYNEQKRNPNAGHEGALNTIEGGITANLAAGLRLETATISHSQMERAHTSALPAVENPHQHKLVALQRTAAENPNSYIQHAHYALAVAHNDLRHAAQYSAGSSQYVRDTIRDRISDPNITPSAIRYTTNAVFINGEPVAKRAEDKVFDVPPELRDQFPMGKEITYKEALDKYEELYREHVTTGAVQNEIALNKLHECISAAVGDSLGSTLSTLRLDEETMHKANSDEQGRIGEFEAKNLNYAQTQQNNENKLRSLQDAANANPKSYATHSEFVAERAHQGLTEIIEHSRGDMRLASNKVSELLKVAVESGNQIAPAELNYVASAISVDGSKPIEDFASATLVVDKEHADHFSGKEKITYQEALSKYEELYREKVKTGATHNDPAMNWLKKQIGEKICNKLKAHPWSKVDISQTEMERLVAEEKDRASTLDLVMTQVEKEHEEREIERLKSQHSEDELEERAKMHKAQELNKVEELHGVIGDMLIASPSNSEKILGGIQSELAKAKVHYDTGYGLSPAQFRYVSNALTVGDKPIGTVIEEEHAFTVPSTLEKYFPIEKCEKTEDGNPYLRYSDLMEKYEELYQSKVVTGSPEHDEALKTLHSYLLEGLEYHINANPKVSVSHASLEKARLTTSSQEMLDARSEVIEPKKPEHDKKIDPENTTEYVKDIHYSLSETHSSLAVSADHPETMKAKMLAVVADTYKAETMAHPSQISYLANVADAGKNPTGKLLDKEITPPDSATAAYMEDHDVTTYGDAIKTYEEMYNEKACGKEPNPQVMQGVHDSILRGIGDHVKQIDKFNISKQTLEEIHQEEREHVEIAVTHLAATQEIQEKPLYATHEIEQENHTRAAIVNTRNSNSHNSKSNEPQAVVNE